MKKNGCYSRNKVIKPSIVMDSAAINLLIPGLLKSCLCFLQTHSACHVLVFRTECILFVLLYCYCLYVPVCHSTINISALSVLVVGASQLVGASHLVGRPPNFSMCGMCHPVGQQTDEIFIYLYMYVHTYSWSFIKYSLRPKKVVPR